MATSFTLKSFQQTSFTSFSVVPSSIQYISGRRIVGTSTDIKPTANNITGTIFCEIDTFGKYIWNGSTWINYESFAQIYTNKTIDAESNNITNLSRTSTFNNSGTAKRTGSVIAACTADKSLVGSLKGLSVNGDGTPKSVVDPTEGLVLKFARAASGIMGYTSTTAGTDTITTRRALNPFLKVRLKTDTIATTTRIYVGFSSASSIPNTDTPLATTDSGVIWGFRSTDSNFSVIYNDGSSTSAVVVSMGVAKDTSYHTVSLTFTSFNVVVVMDDGAGAKTQTLTTRIPATTTDIKLSIMGAY